MSKERTLLKQQEVLGENLIQKSYTSERFMLLGEMAKKIPISIVYKKGYKKNGSAPLLLLWSMVP